ncbi:tripartite tricarboxylate transporter permease [Desulfitibacter alkalitolerans]|uniref:tripartite tricarboxylate transporter permease n=1 Tax=Desulfitibacter alkalitolerans TaxID=264641 RepID=UPI000482B162|nr:tripartite tricarboxylate transporter permease [Desulfitibacter alkalitolerans]
MLEGLFYGLLSVLEPLHLFYLFLAVAIGFLGGALPGISGTMLVIILLPLTYGMDKVSAFLMLTGIYAASVFSGMISAILFRTPGTPEAIATVFDGYPMAQKGHAGRALGTAIFSSVTGGTFGVVMLIFLTPILVSFALKFSSAEYFALAVLGLSVVASLSGGQLIFGLIGVLFGLFIATIGMDPLTGTLRFTFNSLNLIQGINLIPVLIGLFAVSEIFRKSGEKNIKLTFKKVQTKIFDLSIFKRIASTIARSSLLGVFVGILPGVGATTAAMLSYSEAVRWSKNPREFGTGIPEGIAAPESANNAAAMGAMVPLLSFGIPGSATTAVILGAFILHGLQPGPMLIVREPNLVYSIFMGLLLVNLLILVFSKPFISLFSQIMRVPYTVMGPIILVLCIIGTYSVRNSIFDIWIMLIFGVIGFYLEKNKFPLPPIILGVVLGPLAEVNFRRALQMANGDYTIFFSRPISAILLTLAIIAICAPLFKKKSSI